MTRIWSGWKVIQPFQAAAGPGRAVPLTAGRTVGRRRASAMRALPPRIAVRSVRYVAWACTWAGCRQSPEFFLTMVLAWKLFCVRGEPAVECHLVAGIDPVHQGLDLPVHRCAR